MPGPVAEGGGGWSGGTCQYPPGQGLGQGTEGGMAQPLSGGGLESMQREDKIPYSNVNTWHSINFLKCE